MLFSAGSGGLIVFVLMTSLFVLYSTAVISMPLQIILLPMEPRKQRSPELKIFGSFEAYEFLD
jgi:hypothetical protein